GRPKSVTVPPRPFRVHWRECKFSFRRQRLRQGFRRPCRLAGCMQSDERLEPRSVSSTAPNLIPSAARDMHWAAVGQAPEPYPGRRRNASSRPTQTSRAERRSEEGTFMKDKAALSTLKL